MGWIPLTPPAPRIPAHRGVLSQPSPHGALLCIFHSHKWVLGVFVCFLCLCRLCLLSARGGQALSCRPEPAVPPELLCPLQKGIVRKQLQESLIALYKAAYREQFQRTACVPSPQQPDGKCQHAHSSRLESSPFLLLRALPAPSCPPSHKRGAEAHSQSRLHQPRRAAPASGLQGTGLRIPLLCSVLRQGCAEPASGPIPALLRAASPAWPCWHPGEAS